MSYKVIALIGEAGSGKDTMLKEVLKLNPNFNEIISCTTRPIREGEQEGVNYYYLTPEEFSHKITNREMLEHTSFNGWNYGTMASALKEDAINIGVFNPTGIVSLLGHPLIENLQIFYVQAEKKTRLLRQLNRENIPNVDEIVRRYGTDQKDFVSLGFNTYCVIPNETKRDLRRGAKKIAGLFER